MPQVVTVAFRPGHRGWYFDPGEAEYRKDQAVIVETSKGADLGWVVRERFFVKPSDMPESFFPILRTASEGDLASRRATREREPEAYAYCVRRVSERKLSMQLVDAAYSYDGQRIMFVFASESRVDFRELVRDLSAHLKVRVEMQQVGVREKARHCGGVGTCGRELCCSAWIDHFRPTAIRMAKEQGLSLNPAKVSGLCGRLLCCLRYEYDTYVQLRKEAPARGARFETEKGVGRVLDVDVIRCACQVEFPDGDRQWIPYGSAAEKAAQPEEHPDDVASDVIARRWGPQLQDEKAAAEAVVEKAAEEPGEQPEVEDAATAEAPAAEGEPQEAQAERRRRSRRKRPGKPRTGAAPPASGSAPAPAPRTERPAAAPPGAARPGAGARKRRRRPRPGGGEGGGS